MRETTPPQTDLAAGAPPPTKPPTIQRPAFLAGSALVIGLVIEWLINVPHIGFGHALATLVIIAGWLLIGRRMALRPSRSALALLLYLAALGAFLALRASPILKAINILGGLALILLTAAVYLPGRLHQFSLTKIVSEIFMGGLAAIGKPFVLLLSDLPAERAATPADKRGLAPALGGVLLALPLVLLFGGLFYAADAIFADYVKTIFRDIDLADVIRHILLGVWVAWLAMGVMYHAFTRRRAQKDAEETTGRPAGPHLGNTQALIVLGALNVLFLAFVLIQAVYLFGGAETLERAGMTYSDYARRGFFELVAAAALVLVVVLSIDWLTWPRAGSAGKAVNALNILLVVLTFVVMASAVQRMLLYQQVYGLTELRFYTLAFMAWLALVLAWLIATTLRQTDAARADAGRRLFVFGALVAGMTLVLVLNILNPDALIARTNLARSVAGRGVSLDVEYLTAKLSPDAAPSLAAGLPALPNRCTRADLARGLIEQRDRLTRQIETRSWRALTYSQLRAAKTLARWSDSLAAYAAACP